jgi:hypothetical protein
MNISKQTLWREIRDYLVILIGLFSYTIGWTLFLLPNNISTGGVPGVSSILYWAFETPVQVTFFAVNAVLLLLALKILGFKFCIKTIYGVVMLTIILSFFQPLIKDTHLLADQPFMAAIIGGCFCGIGIGLGLVSNGSAGGTDIIAAIIHVLSIGIQYSAAQAIKIPVGTKEVQQNVEYYEVDGNKYYVEADGSINIPADLMAKAGDSVTETVTVTEPLVVISLSGLAVGSLVGIILNAVLPGKDYVFESNQKAAQAKDSTITDEPLKTEKKKKK